MKTYFLKKDLPDANAGTKLFLQDGLYYYKTRTEEDRWYEPKHVEGNKEWFVGGGDPKDFDWEVYITDFARYLVAKRLPLRHTIYLNAEQHKSYLDWHGKVKWAGLGQPDPRTTLFNGCEFEIVNFQEGKDEPVES
jgi:hypothetical protein